MGRSPNRSNVLPMALGAMLVASAVVSAGIIAWHWLERSGESHWTPTNIAESERRGGEIMAALIEFRRLRGTWPASLAELTPGFIAEIEPPTCGNPAWEYVVIAPEDACSLRFCANTSCYPTAWMRSDDPDWSLDQ